MSSVHSLLSTIKQKIVAGGDTYIFRGETQKYHAVSSPLYRAYKRVLKQEKSAQSRGHRLTMDDIQKRIIEDAKAYIAEKDDEAILAYIQHYGGDTNLIDFSRNCWIALFFACDGHHTRDGRLIVYDTHSMDTAKVSIIKPTEPKERVKAQKSIFVSPTNGVLDVGKENIIPIPAKLKTLILRFLQTHHDIRAYNMYQDIHDYIRQHKIYKQAYTRFYRGDSYRKECS